MTPQARAVRPFTPALEPVEELDERTVGRELVLKSLHSKLMRAATSPARPHVLLVGPRGSGKSHVIEVALHRASTEAHFASRMVIARVPADGVAVTRYTDLQDVAIRALGGQPGTQLAGGTRQERLAQLLSRRVLLLVIENLDRVFAAIGTEGQRALRAWVETSGDVLLLASTPQLFPGVADRAQPWFGGMATFLLSELNAAQSRDLLVQIARSTEDVGLVELLGSPTGFARTQALTQLIGGQPRNLIIISDGLSRESLDELQPAVNRLLEGLVPYHEQVLWSLSPNERRIIAALSSTGGGATVAWLAADVEMEPRTAATTLGRLADQGLVAAEKPQHGADRRNTYYHVRDPLLRHHLQYRQGLLAPLELTVGLLRVFFDRAQRGSSQDLQSSPPSAADPRGKAATPEVVLDALTQVQAGTAPPSIEVDGAAEALVSHLLAGAAGDEAQRLMLPTELRVLIDGASNR